MFWWVLKEMVGGVFHQISFSLQSVMFSTLLCKPFAPLSVCLCSLCDDAFCLFTLHLTNTFIGRWWIFGPRTLFPANQRWDRIEKHLWAMRNEFTYFKVLKSHPIIWHQSNAPCWVQLLFKSLVKKYGIPGYMWLFTNVKACPK